MRRGAKPAKAKAEAKPPVARKSLKSADSRVRDLEKRLAESLEREKATGCALTEALEQQTATSELLKIIGCSTFDLQQVFETLAENAVRLCEAERSFIFRFDDQLLRVVATHNASAEIRAFVERNPIAPGRDSATARAALERRTVHVHDAQTDPEYTYGSRQVDPFRTILTVPMLRADELLGVILIYRHEVRPFTDNQIALLETFADHAAIAIENVRLFNETKEAREQQTATSEILRVISSSPTDVQPVFDTIVRNAVRLCGAVHGGVYRFDGELVHSVAHEGYTPAELEDWRKTWPRPVTASSAACEAIRTRSVVRVADIETDPRLSTMTPATQANLRARGSRSILTVPMVRQSEVIGAISLAHGQVNGFADSHVELLKTFADQAVIAIENVRLFNETKEALEQQTATAEILRVISRSQTDVRPVFEAIADAVARLFRPWSLGVYRFDGEVVDLVASRGGLPGSEHRFRELSSGGIRLTRDFLPGRAILDRAAVHIVDVETDLTSTPSLREFARLRGWRAVLQVPMLRDDQPVGVISITRAEPRPFAPSEIELLQTFADQAVIAIENVRLFKELQARTGELTQSVEKLTALGEVSRAVSSTLDVETVLDTIVSRASQLAGADGCAIYEYDEATQTFHVRATHNYDARFVETLRTMPLRRGEGVMGRATETREPTQVADITVPGAYQSQVRDVLVGAGFRAVLSVPLLREEQVIGSLSLNRKAPGEFSPEVIDVLKTFATQSALAIQNARLFREIADKSAQLEAASQHKSEFLANMSHELRTPLNAIIGFSEVLAEGMFGDINEKQTEYLKDILESGRHLLSLINDILDLSKIEAGRMELELSDFDLPNAIENALILVRERASRRGITLGSTIDERLGMIGGDERKVKQVLLNLLSNALKFTPEGGRIDVSTSLHDHVAEVSVADTGIGIAPADQDAVFEEFRQVGAADKKAEGTGLGLALSRKFIELHGGKIWVKSQVGAGSTFTFTLPLRR